jgi:chromosome segregation ATPase
MYLKSVTLKGFKSFPETTELQFSPGVSVIVGPNGSGKSNITDAVLWALGEQSPVAVRGSSMQDVISVGGSSIGARSQAEVEVVLDNEDAADGEFSEISIARRLDRNGEGEYRLNGARCRLVDVIEILSDANLGKQMHSVISQGRVDSIVHSKPRERRLLIEEAAGLGKFRKRRRRAELKLTATRDNLDRALDVEREARRALRPLKEQANAAEIVARIERDELGLKAQLLVDDLVSGQDRLDRARQSAEAARGEKKGLQDSLAAVAARRRTAEGRFAERDRARTEIWGLLNSLRNSQEAVYLNSIEIGERHRAAMALAEGYRLELAPLTFDLGTGTSSGDRAARLVEELGEVGAGLGRASAGLEAAGRDGSEDDRIAGLSEVRSGAEHASRYALRAESLLGEGHRERLAGRLESAESLTSRLGRIESTGQAISTAIRERVAGAERSVMGEDGDTDDIASELKACSEEEAALQASLGALYERVTGAEVEAAHLEDRHSEAEAGLGEIADRLDRPVEELRAACDPLDDEGRAGIDRKLERLARRREKLGPVNPLAQKEYEEAQAHLSALVEQREDTERAMRELEGMIRDIDAEIKRSFEETFAATATNFEEMIGKLFPGGTGRLRSVDLEPRREGTLGGGSSTEAGVSEADGDLDEAPEDEEAGAAEFGVELEVSPKGKRTQEMRLLSGGEKALTALAFVFAVFLARPSPFYILDEVEAALDDTNIGRFLDLIRKFSDRAQFIIVTHQKLTMDAADVLYGVSMGGDGVSKVVSRRLPASGSGLEEVEVEEAA